MYTFSDMLLLDVIITDKTINDQKRTLSFPFILVSGIRHGKQNYLQEDEGRHGTRNIKSFKTVHYIIKMLVSSF